MTALRGTLTEDQSPLKPEVCMRIELTARLQRYIEDQVRAGRFESEDSAMQVAVAKMMLADHDIELSADEIATQHDATLPDYEKFLDAMLERRCEGTSRKL